MVGTYRGKHFFLELKSVTQRPKRPTTKIRPKVREAQKIWLKKVWRCGGNCFVYVSVGQGKSIKTYLIPGNRACEIDEVTEEGLEDMSYILPEAGFDRALQAIRYGPEEGEDW